jgi:hypothetical protein
MRWSRDPHLEKLDLEIGMTIRQEERLASQLRAVNNRRIAHLRAKILAVVKAELDAKRNVGGSER